MSNLFSGIKIWPRNSGKLRASGKVTIAEAAEVSVAVMDGSNGLWVTLPSHKGKKKDEETGEEKDFYYPDVRMISKDLKDELESAVIKEYKKVIGQKSEAPKKEVKKTREVVEDDIPY